MACEVSWTICASCLRQNYYLDHGSHKIDGIYRVLDFSMALESNPLRLASGADGGRTLTPVRPIACLSGSLDMGEGTARLF